MRRGQAEEVVWRGAEALRPFLVPLDSLEPFPGNPRRGDDEIVGESLERFSQLLPILVDAGRIVAGHSRVRAAQKKGWTHIAAVPHQFADEDEQLAFLVADNGTSRRGGFDEALLAEKLAALRDRYEGTGYLEEDRREIVERVAKLRAAFQPTDDPPPRLDQRSGTSGLFEVPLLLGRDDREDFARLVKIHKREWEIDELTPIVMRLLRESAARL